MTDLDYKKDLSAAMNIIEYPECYDKSYFTEYSKIFNMPSVNHKDLFTKMHAHWQKYLGVMASTNPMLDAISFGAKDITIFDINRLNVYYMYLQIAAVLKLEYEEYLTYFYSADLNKYFNYFYFNKLKNELPLAVKAFWEDIYKSYNIEKLSTLFYYGPISTLDMPKISNIDIRNQKFLDKENFNQLKTKLKQIKMKYIISDFGDVPNILSGKKFDVIYLSAMQNYIWDNVHGYNYFEKLKEYENLLEKDGVIQGGYIYWFSIDRNKDYSEWFMNTFQKNDYEKQKIDIVTGVEREDYYNVAMLKRNRKI